MRAFLTYGAGAPRYVALWLPLAPVLVAALLALRVRLGVVLVVLTTTLPTFLLHNPPASVPHVVRWTALLALLGGIAWWIGRRLTAGCASSPSHLVEMTHNPRLARGTPPRPLLVRGAPPRPLLVRGAPPRPRGWAALGAIAVVALAVRVPLAWVDPGISDIPQASETAARQLLAGVNPYTVANPYTVVGAYQYPAGSVLAHVPFVALLPHQVGGESWIPARALLWTASAAVVLVLGFAAARFGGPRAGVAAAVTAALHPTLVRESALTVANDAVLGLLVACAAIALARGRRLWCGAFAGLAVSVKPAAVVLLPFIAVAAAPAAAAVAVAVPAALQLPFLLWPAPGFHGVAAMLEPATRLDPIEVLRQSAWWPVYLAAEPTPSLLRAVAVAGMLAAAATAAWAGAWVRRTGTAAVVALGIALPLWVAFVLGHRLRLNFQDWALVPLVIGAVLEGAGTAHHHQFVADVDTVSAPPAHRYAELRTRLPRDPGWARTWQRWRKLDRRSRRSRRASRSPADSSRRSSPRPFPPRSTTRPSSSPPSS